jgi:hypothetical protein
LGSCCLREGVSSASEPSSEDRGEVGGCGAGGRGTMMVLSRDGGARRGREDKVWVVARRRELHRQW